ncbi:MAG: glycoside hydrolase family 3 C-terminal domain-containing protein [Actinomyces sp.]|jgi:beta-glucosidase|nr:glycoside hydrolase family 3 N-terminal domain-containing protein [Actinomyces sp.]MCI1641647.1 glycoside hydrolase family 3 C-terminal domain-containing protein [Actinomyces sp.]MCI1661880.1 glycoside hydrolase family 3 C-terminal domain-containing protein [Actinomyces sp.]MCI1690722.1 glycoside hydrolase family 3 C-terminal domain-containing protein [Actinomyces sp.]MCI1787550.1 glycoside hydrolase family 3 C-terminal domain-containing protein [Actinomyces sp.]MCI1829180.1 glycoside hydro
MTRAAAGEPGRGTARAGDDVESLVARTLSELSLREKVGQLNQRLFGWEAVERRGGRWRLTDAFLREAERWSGIGALYGVLRADAWSGRSWDDGIGPDDRREVVELVQDAVRGASPRSIGALIVEEAPHGHQALGGTVLPTNLALAATWDPDLVREAGESVAAELWSSGVDIALVSGLDVLRDPRWGRGEECFGESAALAAEMARAVVEGMQGRNRGRLGAGGVGVVMKHFAAQGEAAGGRNGQSSVIGARDLEEIHLWPARTAVRAGAVGLMAAYNDIDGVPCCANPWLLTTWLREQEGFDGIVMADGLAVDRLAALAGTPRGAGRLALLSGVDMSLWDEGFTTLVETAVEDAAVANAVDEACRRVLRLKARLGLLRAPDPDAAPGAGAGPFSRTGADLEAARRNTERISARAARESLVALTGDPCPLAGIGGPVAVLGPYAEDMECFLGDYVAPLPPERRTSVRAELGRMRPVTDGPAGLEEDPRALREASAVVLVLGGTSHRSCADEFDANGAARATVATSGEGVDLADVSLPEDQVDLVRRVRAATAAPLAVVIVSGRPLVLTGIEDPADSILWAGYAGPHGPAAVAEALTGAYRPAGRLPVTLLADPGAIPLHHDDRHPGEDVYRDAPRPVLHAFADHQPGAGDPAVDDLTVEWPERNRATIRVHLDGGRPEGGEAVVAVFARRTGGPVVPRLSELLAFRRLEVPGEGLACEWSVSATDLFGPDDDGTACELWTDPRHRCVVTSRR